MFSITFMVVAFVPVTRRRLPFPFLPETLRAVAKKMTGVTAICVLRCDATLRPDEAARPGDYFGASEATIFSNRGSPRSESSADEV